VEVAGGCATTTENDGGGDGGGGGVTTVWSGVVSRGLLFRKESRGRRVWTYAKDAADNTDGAPENSRVPRRRSVQTYIFERADIACV